MCLLLNFPVFECLKLQLTGFTDVEVGVIGYISQAASRFMKDHIANQAFLYFRRRDGYIIVAHPKIRVKMEYWNMIQ